MNFDYVDCIFVNTFFLISSIALFLGTIRFGDEVVALFKGKK